MYYVATNQGDKFIHLFKNNRYEIENGWDGGDLRKLPMVREYYAKS